MSREIIRVFFCDHAGDLIHEDSDGYPFRHADWKFAYGAKTALRVIQSLGYGIAVFAGHSGVAREYYTRQQMIDRHEEMNGQLAAVGVHVMATGYCPHHPDFSGDCDCRKPKTGTLDQISDQLSRFQIDLPNSVLLGDKPSDIELASRYGIGHRFLSTSRYWKPGSDLQCDPTMIVTSLPSAADQLFRMAIHRELISDA